MLPRSSLSLIWSYCCPYMSRNRASVLFISRRKSASEMVTSPICAATPAIPRLLPRPEPQSTKTSSTKTNTTNQRIHFRLLNRSLINFSMENLRAFPAGIGFYPTPGKRASCESSGRCALLAAMLV